MATLSVNDEIGLLSVYFYDTQNSDTIHINRAQTLHLGISAIGGGASAELRLMQGTTSNAITLARVKADHAWFSDYLTPATAELDFQYDPNSDSRVQLGAPVFLQLYLTRSMSAQTKGEGYMTYDPGTVVPPGPVGGGGGSGSGGSGGSSGSGGSGSGTGSGSSGQVPNSPATSKQSSTALLLGLGAAAALGIGLWYFGGRRRE